MGLARTARVTYRLLAVLLVLSGSCTSRAPVRSEHASPSTVVWPTERWPSASPESEGLDPGKLAEPLEGLRARYVQMHSLLIVRGGSVVLDAYVYPYDRSMYHDLAAGRRLPILARLRRASGRRIARRLAGLAQGGRHGYEERRPTPGSER